jgi:sulfur-carrier protein adenylyltransferase/sulfurtransferase
MATTIEIPATLSKDEILRYSRHLIMPEVGMEGQQKLKAARVLCIGTGGLGSPLALYLAAAGVGTLGLVDFDVVDYTNLQRQIIHSTADVGRKKLDSAADKLTAINPFLNLQKYDMRLSSENALELFRNFDIIADGTDNFPTRYLVNDACVLTGKPNVYGSIFRFEGQASVFATKDGPCYRCLYPEPPPPGLVPSCAEGGVLGILPGLVGVMQATEVIKLILGAGEPLIGRLLLIDALGMKFRELKLRKNPDCPVCGTRGGKTGGIRRSRNSSRGVEAPSGCERGSLRPRRARAPRISDLQHRRTSDSAQRPAQACARTGFQPRNRGPLQNGRTQRESSSLPAAVGFHESS